MRTNFESLSSNFGLVKKASRHWESYNGCEYVAYDRIDPDDPHDTPFSWGVAVYKNGRLIAIGFMPVYASDFDGYGFRKEYRNFYAYLFSREQYAKHRTDWRSADPGQIAEIENEWECFGDSSCIRFNSRLALKYAYMFGFISEIPEGYLEDDRASRRPVVGRLTVVKMRQLIIDGAIKAGQTVYIRGEKFTDTAPNRKVLVQTIGARLDGKDWVGETPEEMLNLIGQGKPLIVAEFPQHVIRGTPWTYPMGSRSLCYRNGKLFWVDVKEDEWFVDQYEEAERQGKAW